jgi:hypothetical protein
MSDVHVRPLMGHDLPEAIPPRIRERAQVYKGPEGWFWLHRCAPCWYDGSDFPCLAQPGALAGALRHLKGCCK